MALTFVKAAVTFGLRCILAGHFKNAVSTSERNEAVLKVALAPLRHDGGEDVEVITTWETTVSPRNPMLLFAHSPIGDKTVETDFDHLQSCNLINRHTSISDTNRKL